MINVGGFRPDPKPEPKPKKAPARIKQKSKKQHREDKKYNKARKVFLEGRQCAKCKHTKGTQVHHKKGRKGYADKWALLRGITLLHDQRHWLPVCDQCHTYIETHPDEAKEKGWSETRQDIIFK